MFRLRFLDSYKKTMKYLAIIMFIALAFFTIYIAIYSDAYYTCCSDDLLQYFKISEDFALRVRSGDLSFYSYNNYLGASYFSDTYYIQHDFFSVISIILSFIMNFELAFGITETIKLFAGTLMFAYFLHLRKFSNKAVFVTSLIYFICGYNSVMMAFSGFFSLVFYYPFAAVCLEKFKTKNGKLLLPLCSAILVFYNFYLGACVMLFMAVWFILSYFLDNKLITIKEELKMRNPNGKHLTLRAILIYLKRGFASGIVCALYMVVGILIACVILLPSISFFLTDSYPRTDSFYKWSFNPPRGKGYELFDSLKMYMRILGNLFTPTYSTDFYGFINDYITDHNSLYITTTGLIIFLVVIKLKDRESWIYKIMMVIEVIFLLVPIFYMLFSLNSCPYTRWFGMLNMINLVIVAHVITKTDLKLNLLSIGSIITNLLLICSIVYVLNYYLKSTYQVDIIGFITGKERTLNERLSELYVDMILMVVAIGIIVVISLLSFKKVQKKFNIMPYVLAFELVVGFGFMFVPKSYNYNTLWFSDRKEELNSYLSAYLENPYETNFARTHVKSYITDDFIYSDNYSRTNLYLSDLRIFHSFYDANTNDMAMLMYDNYCFNAETRNSKFVLNNYSIFVHQILANRYVVVDSEGDYNYNLPEEYFTLLDDDGQFKSYENNNYRPFTIYTSAIKEETLKTFKNHVDRQQAMLNQVCLSGENYGLSYNYPTINSVTKRVEYKEENYEIDNENNMIGYVLDTTDSTLPSKGVLHFYLNGYDSVRAMEYNDVLLEYNDGSLENVYSGFAYYEELPTKIWFPMNYDYNSLEERYNEKDLKLEYTSYDESDLYLTRMQNYTDQELKIDGSNLHVSYKRNNDETNIIVLPISYNECWSCSKDYQLIKANGGLLGIVVPEGGNEIAFDLSFKPRYLNGSALISVCGIIIYSLILISNFRRLKENEEDYNYCTLL